jgi:Predicted nucleotide kinase (related to CMP and AMP kinases)
LRCHPETLESRLRERGASQAKISENAQSEALDVILSEAVSEHGRESVYEVDTTSLTPFEVAEEITAVRQGDRTPSAGTVDFTDYL